MERYSPPSYGGHPLKVVDGANSTWRASISKRCASINVKILTWFVGLSPPNMFQELDKNAYVVNKVEKVTDRDLQEDCSFRERKFIGNDSRFILKISTELLFYLVHRSKRKALYGWFGLLGYWKWAWSLHTTMEKAICRPSCLIRSLWTVQIECQLWGTSTKVTLELYTKYAPSFHRRLAQTNYRFDKEDDALFYLPCQSFENNRTHSHWNGRFSQ